MYGRFSMYRRAVDGDHRGRDHFLDWLAQVRAKKTPGACMRVPCLGVRVLCALCRVCMCARVRARMSEGVRE